MKKIFIVGAAFGVMILTGCSSKSEANKEQIEEARRDAVEMTGSFDASKSMKPTEGKVVMDTTSTTEIIVSEEKGN